MSHVPAPAAAAQVLAVPKTYIDVTIDNRTQVYEFELAVMLHKALGEAIERTKKGNRSG